MAQKLIAGGAWVQVKIMINGVLKALGMANSVSYDEDWGLQQAKVIGYLGPISIDSQDYNCNITMGAFVPELPNNLYQAADGGEITISDLLPIRDDIQVDGKGKTFDQLVFVNKATQQLMHQFENVVLASNGEQVNPNAYVTANARFISLKRSK